MITLDVILVMISGNSDGYAGINSKGATILGILVMLLILRTQLDVLLLLGRAVEPVTSRQRRADGDVNLLGCGEGKRRTLLGSGFR